MILDKTSDRRLRENFVFYPAEQISDADCNISFSGIRLRVLIEFSVGCINYIKIVRGELFLGSRLAGGDYNPLRVNVLL